MDVSEGAKTRTTPLLARAFQGTGEECLVQIYGRQLGRRHALRAGPVLLGRAEDADVVVESDTVSRHHARLEREDSGVWVVTDLQSTNGTYVNDALVGRDVLANGDFIRVGDTIFKFLSGDNIESSYYEEIYRSIILDGLTQISNRRYFNEFLERELSRARRHARGLALVLLDVDHFKSVNDRFGHLAGDFVLQELATLVRPRVRRDELFARIGGEEFALVLPESSLDDALQLAEQLRAMVERHRFPCDAEHIPVTISLGAAALTPAATRIEDLVRAADEALYRAKAGGRNTVRS